MKIKQRQTKVYILLIIIILLGTFFRFFGINWDQDQHLHPDERFLTMVAVAVKIPPNLKEYLDPQRSTLNPYNLGYNYFVYGTFPLTLTRIIGEISKNIDYGNIHFVGRMLSAIFDLGVIFLIFKIGQKIWSEKVGLLSAFLYSIMVLPIQLSHFFAVDTFLNFFIVLSFYLLVILINNSSMTKKKSLIIIFSLGCSFALALASKISTILFAPILALGFLYFQVKQKNLIFFIFSSFLIIISAYLTFRFSQPSAFASISWINPKINPHFINNLKEQRSYDNPDSFFPPAIQWKSTKPIIFPLKNLVLWGLGLPLGTIVLSSIVYLVILITCCLTKRKANDSSMTINDLLIVLWIFGLFAYQGSQFAKNMRYFLPTYPFLALVSANFLIKAHNFLKKKFSYSYLLVNCLLCKGLFLIALIIYPVSFLSIYTHPTTRVSASKWIYENIPGGVTALEEEWDDGLPLSLPNYSLNNYKKETVFMYDPDTPEKWLKINQKLEKVDYIFLTSNRAYGSTMKRPQDYPQTIKYYQSLFNGISNFQKIAEFTSRPCFPPLGRAWFCFNDDQADESFTVYDHPKVTIFKKNKIIAR